MSSKSTVELTSKIESPSNRRRIDSNSTIEVDSTVDFENKNPSIRR